MVNTFDWRRYEQQPSAKLPALDKCQAVTVANLTVLRMTQLGASGVVLSLDVWCADALAAITFRCDLLEQAAKRFNMEGIRISIPQTKVVGKDDCHFKRPPEKPSAGVKTP